MAYSPIFMKHSNLVLGDEATGPDFKAQVKSVKLTPDVSTETISTLDPAGQYAEVSEPSWTLEIGYLEGVGETSDAVLSEYLETNHGKEVEFVFRPKNGGPGHKGKVRVVVGASGGDSGSWAEQSVTLPVVGQPVRVEAKAG